MLMKCIAKINFENLLLNMNIKEQNKKITVNSTTFKETLKIN